MIRKKMTREEYDKLTNYEQGYVTYMLAEWTDSIPKENPHPEGGHAWVEWNKGNFSAMQHTQDSEE